MVEHGEIGSGLSEVMGRDNHTKQPPRRKKKDSTSGDKGEKLVDENCQFLLGATSGCKYQAERAKRDSSMTQIMNGIIERTTGG